MLFSNAKKKLLVVPTPEGNEIEVVDRCKYLLIDDYLTFKTHAESLKLGFYFIFGF